MTALSSWTTPTAHPALVDDEVHVWLADLDECARRFSDGDAAALSTEELERAGKFHHAGDRERFVAGKMLLRTLLGRYMDVSAREVCFDHGPHGKPCVARAVNGGLPQFNVSHSKRWLLIAVAQNREVGIDIEQPRADIDPTPIARRYFSRRELEDLNALPVAERTEAFFRCWTRKEACVKAWGGGLSIALDSFDVALQPGSSSVLLPGGKDRVWSLQDVAPIPDHAAALAVQGTPCRVQCWLMEM